MARGGFVGLVAAVSPEFVIAADGRTPWHYPADLRRFKNLTMGTTVIMGRGTFEAIDTTPLVGRENFVVTRAGYGSARTFRTVPDALAAARGDVWVIGGSRIFEAAIAWADRIDLVHVPDRITSGDRTFFPTIDADTWTPGPREPLAEDPRLAVQTFVRRTEDR